jgi:type II secretory pathway component GspD/PulD (secretin)
VTAVAAWALVAVVATLAGCVQETVRPHPKSLRIASGDLALNEPTEMRGAEHAHGPRPVENAKAQVAGATATSTAPQDEALHADVAPPDGASAKSPFHRFEWNLVRNPDGSSTKLYYFRAQPAGPGAAAYVDLLKHFIPGFSGLAPDQDYWVKEKFLIDPRKESHDTWRSPTQPGGPPNLVMGAGQVADLFMVTAPDDMLRQIDAFLSSVLAEVPQIEIETTIVEIALSDEMRTGVTWNVQRGTPTDPSGSLVQNAAIKLAQNLVSGTFGTFQAIHGDTTINALIELLESTTDSQVLSAPKLAVLNGHRAIIDTGSETPFFTPTFSGTGVSTVTTQFKPTGISVVVTPFILTADTVQLEISVEVSAVTGFVSAAVSADASVENPLISRRNAHTVVNVPSGKTVMIGGLVTTDDIEEIDKVPLLGDIPLLGYLFKRRTKTFRKAQVLFFVKPRIVEGKFRDSEIYDPTEELKH